MDKIEGRLIKVALLICFLLLEQDTRSRLFCKEKRFISLTILNIENPRLGSTIFSASGEVPFVYITMWQRNEKGNSHVKKEQGLADGLALEMALSQELPESHKQICVNPL